MLLEKDSMKVVDTKLIQMVDFLSFINSYPWGKETFQLTMDYLKKKHDLKKKKKKKKREVFDEKQTCTPYIISTIREMKMDYMVMFKSYTDEVKNNVLDGLNKDLQGVNILTSNEDSDDDGDLDSNSIGVRVSDDVSPSTSKDVEGTSVDGDLHKCVAMLKEVVLDIAAYIKEKRLKKKEKNERQHERGNFI
ncbi:hypothetical protein FXO38_31364 [Capsicum annuum]|nr:hypothetical protein FXO38_31364 [Capsicum annuum]KAF3676535.1 hypothetical protein FXO37_05287 [Capsicum annuum]